MRMSLSTRLWLAWQVLRGSIESVHFSQDTTSTWGPRVSIDLVGETARQYRKRMHERGSYL